MKLRELALSLCVLPLTAPVMAETVRCPDLTTAVQVGACPSEDELQFTFTGYCSDNARMYKWQEAQVCTDYRLYRQLKNVALWETGKGDFQAYVSCDLAADKVKVAQPKSIAVSRAGKLTRVVCTYADDLVFAYRTKAQCRVEGSGDCAGRAEPCTAICE